MLTPLEQSVLDAILAESSEPFDTIRQQLHLARIVRRELTGVGFFTEFALSDDAPVRRDLADFTFGGVGAELQGLKHGAGFLLFVRGGVVSMLEGFTYDEPWPTNTDEFRVFHHES